MTLCFIFTLKNFYCPCNWRSVYKLIINITCMSRHFIFTFFLIKCIYTFIKQMKLFKKFFMKNLWDPNFLTIFTSYIIKVYNGIHLSWCGSLFFTHWEWNSSLFKLQSNLFWTENKTKFSISKRCSLKLLLFCAFFSRHQNSFCVHFKLWIKVSFYIDTVLLEFLSIKLSPVFNLMSQ